MKRGVVKLKSKGEIGKLLRLLKDIKKQKKESLDLNEK